MTQFVPDDGCHTSPVAAMASQAVEIHLFNSDVKSYNMTPTTFVKRELPDTITRPSIEHRFTVEAAALRLLGAKTSIPVPKLINYGQDQNGLWYLETEFIDGSVPGDMEECGFFAQEIQHWKFNREGQFSLYEDMGLVCQHIKLITG